MTLDDFLEILKGDLKMKFRQCCYNYNKLKAYYPKGEENLHLLKGRMEAYEEINKWLNKVTIGEKR